MNILVVDDESGIRNAITELLSENHSVVSCGSGDEALRVLGTQSFDLVITDNLMPGTSGIDLIAKGKQLSPHTSFLMMTAYGSVDQAVSAIKAGADDYLLKPFELFEIEHRVAKLETLRRYAVTKQLHESSESGLSRILGSSAAAAEARRFVSEVAPVTSPVLLLGDSGTGKEVMARAIHECSQRAQNAFVPINCANLNEQLIESELFGHEKGAFTGATSAKPGKFELANGGTIFLDEIGELPLGLQTKLLRVLQEKEFNRVGGVRTVRSDARVIAATNRPLENMVKDKTFREDLFFRLNVMVFKLRPLKDRKEDIPIFIQHYWTKISTELGRKVALHPKTIEKLCRYPFPGNVRELQNLLERLVVRSGTADSISPESLTSEPGGESASLDLEKGFDHLVEDFERQLVEEAMKATNHNQVKAAKLLKITRNSLQYRLRKFGYEVKKDLKKDDEAA